MAVVLSNREVLMNGSQVYVARCVFLATGTGNSTIQVNVTDGELGAKYRLLHVKACNKDLMGYLTLGTECIIPLGGIGTYVDMDYRAIGGILCDSGATGNLSYTSKGNTTSGNSSSLTVVIKKGD